MHLLLALTPRTLLPIMVNAYKTISIVFFLCLFTSMFTLKIKPRIYNGEWSAIGQFPYFAFLKIKYNINDTRAAGCGGAIIDDQWILTAAHCLSGAKKVKVMLGITNLRNNDGATNLILTNTNDFYTHPFYVPEPIAWNDIALIRLPEPIELTEHIQKIKLPADCRSNENVDSVVMGFGRRGTEAPPSMLLNHALMRTLSMTECRHTFPFPIMFRKSVVCAHSFNKQRRSSVCKGDSGSPLVRQLDNTLIGIVSFTKPDCEEGYPQGFTNVISYFDWISKVTDIQLPDC